MTTETVEPLFTPEADPKPNRRRPAGRSIALSIGKHVALIAVSFVMVYPILWMIVSSFRPNDEIFRHQGLLITDPNLDNYVKGWVALNYPFDWYLTNSLIITVGSIIGNMLSCSLAAYAFARLKFRGRGILFAVMLMTIMLPGHVVVVPQYILFTRFLGWGDTFLPLVVPKLLATDSFFVFLMVQFIRGLPRELDEAARIDGCGHFRIYWRIILPLMTPALATTAIFTFIAMWNEFFLSLIYLTSPENMTAPLALRIFLDSVGESNWGAMFAMSVVSLAPIFLVFLFGQRYLTRGIATTGIK